jgi:DNA-binding response OmpR family regulator
VSPPPPGRGARSNQSDSGTILVVEDPSVGSFLLAWLSRKGYQVMCVDRAAALTLLGDATQRIDLLITNTPRAFAAFPGVPLLYLAALPDPAAMRGFQRCASLRKPFLPAELLQRVEHLIP